MIYIIDIDNIVTIKEYPNLFWVKKLKIRLNKIYVITKKKKGDTNIFPKVAIIENMMLMQRMKKVLEKFTFL